MASQPSKTKDPIVEFLVEEFKRYEKYLYDRFKIAGEIVEHWNNKPPSKNFDWMNAVHCPITFASEQTITPRIFSALFPTETPIDVRVFGEATEGQGIRIKTALEHNFRLADVQGESMASLVQNTLLGTGYVEIPYLYRKAWQVNRMGERYLAVVDRRPDCKSVNFFEMYPHPAKLHMNDGLPIIRRRYCDAEFLKNLAESPDSKFENLQDALNSDSTVNQSTPILDEKGRPMDMKKRDEYEMLEYWGPWDDSYTGPDKEVVKRKAVPYWITIINRSVKVRSIPNPYNFQHPPYAKFIFFPECKPSWFGVGIGTVGKPTQERLNKIINQRLDNVDLVLNKQGCYNGNDPLINPKKLQVSKPGQWHKVSDTISSIKWMDTPDVTASSYKEEELAKADFREATGAAVPLVPTATDQHDTATGINLLQGAAGIRFRPVLKKLEKDFISEVAIMFLSHLQQFQVLPEWMQMVTDDGTEQPILVKPEDLQAKTQIIPTGVSETLNKEVMIGQLLRFKEVGANDPTINQAELNKRIAELMGFKDISKIIIQQNPTQMGPGQLSPEEQQYVQKRLAEGASPEQIKLEMLGQPPQGVSRPGAPGAGPDQPMAAGPVMRFPDSMPPSSGVRPGGVPPMPQKPPGQQPTVGIPRAPMIPMGRRLQRP